MTKQELIDAYLQQPIKVGDVVYVRGLEIKNKNDFGNSAKVLSIEENDDIYIKESNSAKLVKKEDYKKSTRHIGENPFQEKPFQHKIRVLNFDIGSVLHSVGYERNKKHLELNDLVILKFRK